MNKLTEFLTKPFTEEDVLAEGARDPGIFKAIFLAGGPGSGKSYVAGGLFGIPDKVNVSAYGLKLVNQDTELENFLKKYFGTTDLDNMPDDLFRQITDPGYSAHMGVRKHAKALSKQRLKLYSKGRLGVIIDGTGHKYKSVKKERQKLINMGYDTFMVYVNTSLDVAQKRNQKRARVLPIEVVEKYWKEVQNNLAFFQGLFGGSNFLIVDNNKHLDPDTAKKKFNMLIDKGLKGFLNKPLKSKIAKKWVKQQKLVPKKDLKRIISVFNREIGRFVFFVFVLFFDSIYFSEKVTNSQLFINILMLSSVLTAQSRAL